MAAAAAPTPSRAVPVLVMRLGDEGSFSMISEARSEGGVGVVAIDRLECRRTKALISRRSMAGHEYGSYALKLWGRAANALGRTSN